MKDAVNDEQWNEWPTPIGAEASVGELEALRAGHWSMAAAVCCC